MIDTYPTEPATITFFHARGKEAERVERIKTELRNAANSFVNAGLDLREAYRNEEWKDVGLENFTQYCQQFDITDSWGYDLIRIADVAESFPDYRARILDVGISKMRLLLPHIPESASAEQIDTLLDDAAQSSYRELRRDLNTTEASAPLPPAVNYCPACGIKLHLSRAANLEIAE